MLTLTCVWCGKGIEEHGDKPVEGAKVACMMLKNLFLARVESAASGADSKGETPIVVQKTRIRPDGSQETVWYLCAPVRHTLAAAMGDLVRWERSSK